MPTALLAFLLGFLTGPLAHHLAVQAGADHPWALSSAVCRRCGAGTGRLIATCPACGLRPWRSWATAAAVGIVSGALAWRIEANFVLAAYLAFAFLTVVLFLTDIDHKRIPNRITYPGIPAAAALLLAGSWLDGTHSAFPQALAGAGAYAGFFLVVYLVARGGFGFGDVKLAVLLGLFLAFEGWDRLLVAGFMTAAIGGLMAIGAVVAAGAGAKTEIPYGPAMIMGAWITVIGGERLAGLFL